MRLVVRLLLSLWFLLTWVLWFVMVYGGFCVIVIMLLVVLLFVVSFGIWFFGCLVYNCYASLVCVFWMICCGIVFILVWLCDFCLFEFCGCLNYCSCLRVG